MSIRKLVLGLSALVLAACSGHSSGHPSANSTSNAAVLEQNQALSQQAVPRALGPHQVHLGFCDGYEVIRTRGAAGSFWEVRGQGRLVIAQKNLDDGSYVVPNLNAEGDLIIRAKYVDGDRRQIALRAQYVNGDVESPTFACSN
jgi:hypothetical protein